MRSKILGSFIAAFAPVWVAGQSALFTSYNSSFQAFRALELDEVVF